MTRIRFLNNDTFQLALPSEPEFVVTARLFVAAVARHLGIEEEVVEDLRLAASEACNGAINFKKSQSDAPIEFALRVMPSALEIEVTAMGNFPRAENPWNPSTPTGDFQQSLSLGLLSSMFEDTEWENLGDRMKISFSTPISQNSQP